jgi:phosphatidylglycerol:prolipoprotein diacylglycerol transferase
MIDPIIFEFKLFTFNVVLRWYGVLVMLGAVIGALIAEREIRRRGENGEVIWDAMVWVLPIGIIGARLWYVVNNILGGSTYYTDDPSKILKVWEGGLHIFGGFLFGVIALYFFLKSAGKDVWLFLDAIAPAALIGQALARPANFINQELYGQPTNLPWGIPIEAARRLVQYADLGQFPVETTRFHPTFAYEMILNILIALFLLWAARRYEETIKPGTIFVGWMVLAGLSRTFIEFFRPDQPRIGDSFVSYTMLVSFLMAVAGAVLYLARYKVIQLAATEDWEEEYQITQPEKKVRTRTLVSAPAKPAASAAATTKVVKKAAPSTRTAPARKTATVKKKVVSKKKPAARKPAAKSTRTK